jgi:serine/threonine protein kinase
MIALKCPQCGRAIEVSDSMRGVEIPCARCGQVLLSSASPDSTNATELGLSPLDQMALEDIAVSAGLSGGNTTNQSGGDDTLIPTPTAPAPPVLTFLSPPKGPYELGWLSHYQVLRLLGQGGMGYVFEAVDSELQRTVALKVMKPALALDDSARKRFLREARAMASVKNDHIVSIHHVGQSNNVPFLAMEFLSGESLEKRLERPGRMSVPEIVRLSIEIARGLAAAHARGLIHRDIKPANIWLETKDDGAAVSCVKILDFGLARLTGEESHLTQVGMLMGTPAYMAPEQVEGKPADARCDLFSLGCVMYEMATGTTPFEGPTSIAVLMAVAHKHPKPPREVNPDLPPPLAKRILQLLSKDPQQRPASAQEVVALLQDIAAHLGIETLTPPGGTARPSLAKSEIPQRRSYAIAAVLTGCIVAAGMLVWFLSH